MENPCHCLIRRRGHSSINMTTYKLRGVLGLKAFRNTSCGDTVMSNWNNSREPGESHHRRRLTDTICFAFNQACDQEDLETAAQLAQVLEMMNNRRPLNPDTNRRRRDLQMLTGINQRLHRLQNPVDD